MKPTTPLKGVRQIPPSRVIYFVTVSDKFDSVVDTPSGKVSFLDWLKSEQDRFSASGIPTEIGLGDSVGSVLLAVIKSS